MNQSEYSSARDAAKDCIIRVRLDEDLFREMEEAMAMTGNRNKSEFMRRALFNEVVREKRRHELEALQWEQRKEAVRRDGSDDPFPKEQ